MLANALAVLSLAFAAPGDEVARAQIDRHCTDCHGKLSRKAGLTLEPLVAELASSPLRSLRLARDRVRRGDMPPHEEAQPTPEERQAIVDALEAEMRRREPSVPAGRPTIRRLNRVEFRNAVRELLGVDVDVAASLPADDVGEGFDHIGDVLSMSPILLEKYLDVAERAALAAWPDTDAAFSRKASGTDLKLRGGGQVTQGGALVWSAGAAYIDCELPRDGEYRVSFTAFGDQAGKEPVKVALRDEAKRHAHFDIAERRAAAGTRTATVPLAGGMQRVGIEFLNDFFDESKPQGERDRNLHVLAIEVVGPVDHVEPTTAAASLAGPTPGLEAFVRSLAERAFRRPLAADELRDLVERANVAAGEGASWPQRARAAITATLVDPRFLFHVERDAPPGAPDRPLDGWELADRLASFLWRSVPDRTLADAARRGELDSVEGVRSATRRLLDDPRSIALAEQFGQQWLFIRSVDERQPDPTLFPGVDAPLLADMRAETTLFLDTLLREDRPLSELLSADWTFLNARLARHYGVKGIDGDWLRRARIGDDRVRGLLGHGSVLVATSNPTRTSPVKRGKWVLDAMLDAPPPPPPPGVPQLPEAQVSAERLTARALLERHRADPACAGCHRSMDAIGLALEPLNAVGQWRRSADAGMDLAGDLPDGRRFNGPVELAAMLASDPAVTRSVVRHLLVYALGRPLSEEDHLTVDRIAREVAGKPTFRAVVEGIVASDQFRKRSAPPADVTAQASAHAVAPSEQRP